MVLMAIDHVRVYSGCPGRRADGRGFLHAMGHALLRAGVRLSCRNLGVPVRPGSSAARRGVPDRRALARYLVTRGLLLVAARAHRHPRVVDVRPRLLAVHPRRRHLDAWLVHGAAGGARLAANAGGRHHRAADHRRPERRSTSLGGALPESWRWLWEFVYPVGVEVTLGQHGPSVAVLYSIVPWIGVMAAGYAFGAIMVREPADTSTGSA